MRTFPDLGKELRRGSEIHENCHDCAEFYDGCPAWRASRDFACRDFNCLPNVLPGTCGHVRDDPLKGLAKIHATPEGERRALTEPEIAKLFAGTPEWRHLAYAVALVTGLRLV